MPISRQRLLFGRSVGVSSINCPLWVILLCIFVDWTMLKPCGTILGSIWLHFLNNSGVFFGSLLDFVCIGDYFGSRLESCFGQGQVIERRRTNHKLRALGLHFESPGCLRARFSWLWDHLGHCLKAFGATWANKGIQLGATGACKRGPKVVN